MGAYTTNSSYGWFSLYLDPKGTNIFFSGQTNGAAATYLTASVSLSSNAWTFLALTYSPSNSFLFTNGQLCASGSGVAYYPGPGARTNGFCIGGDSSSTNLAQGQFEWVRTYNYPIGADWVSNFYQMVLTKYGGGPFGPDGPDGPLGPSACVTNVALYMTNTTATWMSDSNLTVSFEVRGGTNNLIYDVFGTTNLLANNVTNSQWVWLTNTYTCQNVVLGSQAGDQWTYVLGTPLDSDHDGVTDAWETLVSHSDIHSPFPPFQVFITPPDPNALLP
jgi:hypothetical protein